MGVGFVFVVETEDMRFLLVLVPPPPPPLWLLVLLLVPLLLESAGDAGAEPAAAAGMRSAGPLLTTGLNCCCELPCDELPVGRARALRAHAGVLVARGRLERRGRGRMRWCQHLGRMRWGQHLAVARRDGRVRGGAVASGPAAGEAGGGGSAAGECGLILSACGPVVCTRGMDAGSAAEADADRCIFLGSAGGDMPRGGNGGEWREVVGVARRWGGYIMLLLWERRAVRG